MTRLGVDVTHSERWQDCFKFLPYRDYLGAWQLPRYTQSRLRDGVIEYRERDETFDEWSARQW